MLVSRMLNIWETENLIRVKNDLLNDTGRPAYSHILEKNVL